MADDAFSRLPKKPFVTPPAKAPPMDILTISDELRTHHTLMIAPTGSGKTQFMLDDIYHLLERDDPPGMIIIDSQGQMMPLLSRLAVFNGRLKDRLIIIDPEHDDPAFNLFSLPKRGKVYDRLTSETVITGAIQTTRLFFAALDQTLTGLQASIFDWISHLIFTIPNATIDDLLYLLMEKVKTPQQSKYAAEIAALGYHGGLFFNQFFGGSINKSRDSVSQRLLGMMRVDAFRRMFGAKENKIDIFEEMNKKNIIIFNTSVKLLGEDFSRIFGTFAIAITMRAMFERESISGKEPLALLFIDEAAEYWDQEIVKILTQMRKYRCGTFMAFQNLGQLGALSGLTLANTGIKMATNIAVQDANPLAAQMRMKPQDLLNVRKIPGGFEFACYTEERTSGTTFVIPYGTVNFAPKMTDSEYKEMRARNKLRVESAVVSTNEAPSVDASLVIAIPPSEDDVLPIVAPAAPAEKPKKQKKTPNWEKGKSH